MRSGTVGGQVPASCKGQLVGGVEGTRRNEKQQQQQRQVNETLPWMLDQIKGGFRSFA